MIFVCIGVMISYIAGAYLTYTTAPFVIMIFPIAFTVSFLLLPESPNDLMKQKRYTVINFIGNSFRYYGMVLAKWLCVRNRMLRSRCDSTRDVKEMVKKKKRDLELSGKKFS